MGVAEELKENAIKYARKAVELDKHGKREEAITAYQKAVENLVKLVQVSPGYNLNKIYMQRVNIYLRLYKKCLNTSL